MSIPPQKFQWSGSAMIPLHPGIANRHFVSGEWYILVEHHDRSDASHRHFFSCVNEAHKQLPEHYALQFHTPDALRKRALIKAGYHDTRSIVCASAAEAQRVTAFVTQFDPDAVVVVNGATVLAHTAQSQSYRAMGKDRFGESKSAVLEVLAEMLSIDVDVLTKNAGTSA